MSTPETIRLTLTVSLLAAILASFSVGASVATFTHRLAPSPLTVENAIAEDLSCDCVCYPPE